MHYNLHSDVEAFSTRIGEELPYAVLQPHQTHTNEVRVITNPATSREELYDVDALVTALPNYAIGVRTADCVPILMYDPVKRVCAAVHAGWRGTVGKIPQRTISVMQREYGCSPADILAVIGPSIGPDSFQVGEEVVEAFAAAGFPMHIIHTERGEKVPGTMQGGHHLDLWTANHWLLEQSGLLLPHIQIAGICTYLHADEYYSARHDGNLKTRRIINVIKMREDEACI